MNLYLIGYRCTGKTTVGTALAERLGWPFVDTDRAIVESVGSDISRMVNVHGWPFFRKQERQIMQVVAAVSGQVVATGGGIILDGRNIAIMKKTGTLVWLTADRKTILSRMLSDATTSGNRPSLTGQGPMEEIESALSERQPLYEKAADVAIDTVGEKIQTLCDRIVDLLGLSVNF